jgi:hypothetical protein
VSLDSSSSLVAPSAFALPHLHWAIASISAHIRRRAPGFEPLLITIVNSLASVFCAPECAESLRQRAHALQTIVLSPAGDANWLTLLSAEIVLLQRLGLASDAVCLVRCVFESAHCCKETLDGNLMRQRGDGGADPLADW